VPRPAEMPGCVEPSRRSRQQCRRWKRFLGDSATVERREAASRMRGRPTPRKRDVARLRARHFRGWRLPALRPPLVRGCCEEEAKNPAQDAGNEETALFDIVKMERREWRIANDSAQRNRVDGNALGPGRGRPSLRPRWNAPAREPGIGETRGGLGWSVRLDFGAVAVGPEPSTVIPGRSGPE
jgi:hypothetical protein